MTSLRSATIRLAYSNPELRPHLLPLLQKTAATRKELSGHVNATSAYLVEDYPYGFKARTQAKFWLESNPSKGFRFVSQTMDPKTGRWNKPKASTYARLSASMYLDEKDHVQWDGLSEYADAAEVVRFLEDFPKADKTLLKRWIPAKIKMYEKFIAANEAGSSGWSINDVPQAATEADLGRNRQSLEDWKQAEKKL